MKNDLLKYLRPYESITKTVIVNLVDKIFVEP